jgi:hypothetical protein
MFGLGRMGRLGAVGMSKAPVVATYVSTYAIDFGGTNEVCSRADSASHDFGSAMSLSCWVNAAATLDYGGVVLKHDFSSDNGYAILRSGANAGKTRCIVTDSGGGTKQYDSSLTAFDSTWHHICFTFGGGVLKIYIDQVLDASPTLITNDAVTNLRGTAVGLRFGSQLSGGTPSNYYVGKLDEVSVWGIELSQAEVTALASGGKPADLSLHSQYANCASWYKCGDGDTNGANGVIDTKGALHLTPANMENGDFAAAGTG